MTNQLPTRRCPACTALTVSPEAIHCTLPGCPQSGFPQVDRGRRRRALLTLKLGERDAA